MLATGPRIHAVDDPRDLYGLPLDRFVTQRAALARALRSAGEREEAARVAKLAKPSAAAWAVNQLVRTQRGAVRRLFDAGDALKQAQREIVEGRRAGAALRDATAVKREALDELMGAARGLLDARGHGPSEATLARISATLDAAALEDHAREQVQDGCLTRELAHIGLGEGLMAGLGAPAADKGSAPAQAATDPAREREDRERARQAEARRAAAQRAARELEQAQQVRERAGREVEAAQERLARAAQALAEADRALAKAREHAQQALDAES